MIEKKLNRFMYVALIVGFTAGIYFSVTNLYHYEIAQRVEEHADDEDSHEGHEHTKTDLTMDDLLKTAELDTANLDMQLQAGRTLHIEGKLEEALVFYRRYERGHALDADLNSELGTLLWKLHPGVEAVKYFSIAIKQDSTHVNSLFGLGVVSLRIGQDKSAKDYFEKVVRYQPESELAQTAKHYMEQIKQ